MNRIIQKFIAVAVCIAFSLLSVGPISLGVAQSLPTMTGLNHLPVPGSMISFSEKFDPTLLRGLKIYPDQPMKMDFIIDKGDSRLEGAALQDESTQLIKYFLAALTISESDLWVNLSPYEQDRIIPEVLAETDMGRDLLFQDYLLKQLASSLMNPTDAVGRKFWNRIYEKAPHLKEPNDDLVNMFNKVWITPDSATIYESENSVLFSDMRLKVLLEKDYLATKEEQASDQIGSENISQEMMRDIIIPEIEREVNEGKNFAPLRKMTYALLLATWYKKRIQNSLMHHLYIDQNKTNGINIREKDLQKKVYQRYMEAYKKGVFNFINEEYDSDSGKLIPKKYFAGGYSYHPRGIKLNRQDAATLSESMSRATASLVALSLGLSLCGGSGCSSSVDTAGGKAGTPTEESDGFSEKVPKAPEVVASPQESSPVKGKEGPKSDDADSLVPAVTRPTLEVIYGDHIDGKDFSKYEDYLAARFASARGAGLEPVFLMEWVFRIDLLRAEDIEKFQRQGRLQEFYDFVRQRDENQFNAYIAGSLSEEKLLKDRKTMDPIFITILRFLKKHKVPVVLEQGSVQSFFLYREANISVRRAMEAFRLGNLDVYLTWMRDYVEKMHAFVEERDKRFSEQGRALQATWGYVPTYRGIIHFKDRNYFLTPEDSYDVVIIRDQVDEGFFLGSLTLARMLQEGRSPTVSEWEYFLLSEPAIAYLRAYLHNRKGLTDRRSAELAGTIYQGWGPEREELLTFASDIGTQGSALDDLDVAIYLWFNDNKLISDDVKAELEAVDNAVLSAGEQRNRGLATAPGGIDLDPGMFTLNGKKISFDSNLSAGELRQMNTGIDGIRIDRLEIFSSTSVSLPSFLGLSGK